MQASFYYIPILCAHIHGSHVLAFVYTGLPGIKDLPISFIKGWNEKEWYSVAKLERAGPIKRYYNLSWFFFLSTILAQQNRNRADLTCGP